MSATLRERIMHVVGTTSGCGCCAPPYPEEYLTEAKGWRGGWRADQILEAVTPAVTAEAFRDAAAEVHRKSRWCLEMEMGGRPQSAVDSLIDIERVLLGHADRIEALS